MESTQRELTENERLMLARENAADHNGYYSCYGSSNRTAFYKGWDAAMEYVNAKLAEGVGHLDKAEVE